MMRRIARSIAMSLLATGFVTTPAEPQTTESDTVVVIVSAASKIKSLPHLHLEDLYLGRTSRFPDGSPAVPIDQKPGTRDRSAFSNEFLGRSEAQIKAHWSKMIFTGRGRPPAEAVDAQELKKLVAENPRAIGYIDRRLVDATVRVVVVN